MPDLLERLKAALADRYAVEAEIGRGGMAVVYLAEDLKHRRQVAIKVLHPELSITLAADRFLQEIRIVAGLEHPHILTLIDSGEADDLLYYIMPYIKGESLRQRLEREGQLPVEDAVRIGSEVADGLDYAHRQGFIHRDVKPGNILLSDRHAVMTDFGVARAITVARGERVTSTGLGVGTPLYASPEQAAGAEALDGRTDVYSLGCVLYEMLSGQVPLSAPTPQALHARRMSETPPLLHDLRDSVPPRLDQAIAKSLSHLPADRWATAAELASTLQSSLEHSVPGVEAGIPIGSGRRRMSAASWALAAVLLSVAAGAYFGIPRLRLDNEQDLQWDIVTGLEEIRRLVGEFKYPAAYATAVALDGSVGNDSIQEAMWADVSRTVTFETNPPGALVTRRDYAPADAEWEELGRTPFEIKRFPKGLSRVRFELEGHHPRETSNSSGSLAAAGPFLLDTEESLPEGMARVTGGSAKIWAPGLEQLDSLVLADFFMDIHEVTNRDYKAFVDGGGYRDPTCWRHPFVKDGRVLSFGEATAYFVDQTGRPGPSGWEVGGYPEGENDLPVGGISWYEAEAYACFVGKALPTVYHWYAAANPVQSNQVVPLSNFGGDGPAQVGLFQGVTRFGQYDMAGNVREWTRNPDGEARFILGGGWADLQYAFNDAITSPAFDRSPANGVRLVVYPDTSNVTRASATIVRDFRDYYTETPVPDGVFDLYADMYAYDPAPLNALLVSADTADTYIKERVEMDAAYGGERLTAFLFIPRNGGGTPPFQTVAYFPGSDDIYSRSYDDLRLWSFLQPILKSGRALVYPIYKGTWERRSDLTTDIQDRTNLYRDHVIAWAKDLRRSIDYVETRADLDSSRLAYYGISWGGAMGGIMTAVEPRFKASVLVVGGLLMQATQPMADPFNFLPRVTVPTLMLNGRYDSFYQIDASLMPFFENLGTPEADKRLVITDSNHYILAFDRNLVTRETLDWFDQYLGTVQ